MIETLRSQSLRAALRTLALDPLSILLNESRVPLTVDADEARTARPTWVGKNYKPGGVLLLGKNPGGGSPSFKTVRPAWDFDFFDALRALREKRDMVAYEYLSDVAQPTAMRQWPLWLSINAVLDALGLDLFSTAIGNFLPFRTQGNSVRADEFKAAWRLDTALMVEVLRPKLIVKMTNEFRTFRDYCPADIKIQQFHRANGDRYITDAGKADLVQLRTIAL
ncbi:MAG TPA: hypothetical protein VHX61_17790 [Rhizomicrobium sp.]|jgi:hypothetical protein|nr:hypothetical protein [Rhizomicrobium sp.]